MCIRLFDAFGLKITPGFTLDKKEFSKVKTGGLSKLNGFKNNRTPKYNSTGLAAALLKYKEVQFL